MFIVYTLLASIFSILGGHLSRMCGGGKPHLPIGLEQFVYALPFGGIFLLDGVTFGSVVLAVLAYAGAVWGKRTGHGQYFLLGTGQRIPENDEELDGIVRFFMGPDRGGDYKRCVVGLAVTGVALTLAPGLLYALSGHFIAGLVILLSGAAKPLGYMLGFDLKNFDNDVQATVVGEYAIGIIQYFILAVVIFS